MACEKPNVFIKHAKNHETGKWIMTMVNMEHERNLENVYFKYGSDHVVLVPCGKCPSCIKTKRREWSLRCEAEARCHQANCFITLTMENKYLKDEVSKDDVREFLEHFHNRNIKVKFFACGEYGENTGRPHYHAILFGYMPDDLKYQGKTKTGFPFYTSKTLSSWWKKGFVTIQDFAPETAGYVAGYVTKKLDFDPDEKKPFVMMSTHPGLGFEYYKNHINELLKVDNFMSKNGFAAPLPRYFEKVCEKLGVSMEEVKEKRSQKTLALSIATAQQHGFGNLEEVFKYQGQKERRKKRFARSL